MFSRIVKIISLALVLLLMSCTVNLPGSGASRKTVKKAVVEVIRETKTEQTGKGKIEGKIVLNINNKPATGTINASFTSEAKGKLKAPEILGKKENGSGESMILKLISLFLWMFIFTIFVTWAATKWISGILAKLAKRSISLLAAGLVVLGYIIFTGYNSFDLICIGGFAWISSNWLYDLAKKNEFIELIGIKKKKK